MYYLPHGFMPYLKGQFESDSPDIFDEISDPKGKAETRQIFDLGSIL